MSPARARNPRNPVLSLAAMQELQDLPEEPRRALAALLGELALDARERAEESWRRRKGPMAVYWRAVSVYAGHIRRALVAGAPRRHAAAARVPDRVGRTMRT